MGTVYTRCLPHTMFRWSAPGQSTSSSRSRLRTITTIGLSCRLPRCLSSPPALSLRIATNRLHRRQLPLAACASPLFDLAVALGVVLLEISMRPSWRGGAPIFRGRRYGARSKRSTTAISARLVVNGRGLAHPSHCRRPAGRCHSRGWQAVCLPLWRRCRSSRSPPGGDSAGPRAGCPTGGGPN
jgi:hypothetical protein